MGGCGIRVNKGVCILVEAVLSTLPMLYLPFNVYLDSKIVSILIEAVLSTLPMLYLPFNVYLDSKRVSILIEAVLSTLPMLYLPYLYHVIIFHFLQTGPLQKLLKLTALYMTYGCSPVSMYN